MRWFELYEAVGRYLPMYNGIPPLAGNDIPSFIKTVEGALKRQDRIIWMLRWHRLWYANQVNANRRTPDSVEPIVSDKQLAKFAAATGHHVRWNNDGPVLDDVLGEASDVVGDLSTYKHYVDLGLAQIDRVVWDKQMPFGLQSELDEIEEQWRERLDHAVETRPDDEKILDFKNGWAWFDLKRGECREEANAMGHCGNAGSKPHDSILSLRKHIEGDFWEPHLTFILNTQTGILGEMKGRGNERPSQKYHDMIAALLKLPMIKGIKGGGYLPQNNFALRHLPDETAQELKTENPNLREAHEIYREWSKEKKAKGLEGIDPELQKIFEDKLEIELEAINASYTDIDYESERVILESEPLERWGLYQNGTLPDMVNQLFNGKLEDELRDEVSNDEAYDLAWRVEQDHRDNVLISLVGNSTHYRLSGVYEKYDAKTGKVNVEISFSDLVLADDEELENITSATEQYDDYGSDDYDWIDLPNDPVEAAIIEYAIDMVKNDFRSKKISPADLIDTILVEYGIESRHINTSRTTTDPRQMKFDL